MQKLKNTMALLIALALVASLGLLPAAAEEEKVTFYTENFDAYENDTAAQAELTKKWKVEDNGSWGNTDGFSLVAENGGKALKMSWLGGRLLLGQTLLMPEAYEIKLQAKGGSTGHDSGFIFVRTISQVYQVTKVFDTATNQVRDAVANDNIQMSLFEGDGDKSDGFENGVGYAGIYLKLHGDKLYIVVKTEADVDAVHTKGIGNLRYAASLPSGKNFENDYVNIKIVEKDQVVSIYAEDTLLGSVAYSELKDSYFTKAVIKDAAGAEVGTTDRAKISSDNTVGFSTRGSTMYLDNIQMDSLSGELTSLKVVPIYDASAPEKGEAIPMDVGKEIGFRFTVPAGDALKSVTYKEMPTYNGEQTAFRFTVFKWTYDYFATIEGEPVYDTTISNHKDNLDCTITFPEPLGSGHYLVVIWEGEPGVDAEGYPQGQPGIWKHEMPTDPNTLIFENGYEAEYGLFVQCLVIENGDPDGTVDDLDATPTPKPATPTPEVTEKPADNTPEVTKVPATKAPADESDSDSNAGLWIAVIVCVVAVCGAAAAVIVIRKKRKS